MGKAKMSQQIRRLIYYFNTPIHISRNFKSVSSFELKFNNKIIENKDGAELKDKRFFDLLDERLESHRRQIVPWLDSVHRLKGLKILEIGCGNGSSTIAFAEQGAIVTAIDVDENLLSDAKIRCQIYGLDVRFYIMNATDISLFFANEDFDLVIFMASLEHMTLDERLQSLKESYKLVAKNGLWCIAGTPNRLHFLDSHTSHIPFFHWLPDELAIKYIQFSSRAEYIHDIMSIDDEKEKKLQFYRWGRGVSFHEIELAVKPLNELKIISDLASFLRRKNWLYTLASKFTSNEKYKSCMHKIYPNINYAFFRPYLDIIILKE